MPYNKEMVKMCMLTWINKLLRWYQSLVHEPFHHVKDKDGLCCQVITIYVGNNHRPVILQSCAVAAVAMVILAAMAIVIPESYSGKSDPGSLQWQ